VLSRWERPSSGEANNPGAGSSGRRQTRGVWSGSYASNCGDGGPLTDAVCGMDHVSLGPLYYITQHGYLVTRSGAPGGLRPSDLLRQRCRAARQRTPNEHGPQAAPAPSPGTNKHPQHAPRRNCGTLSYKTSEAGRWFRVVYFGLKGVEIVATNGAAASAKPSTSGTAWPTAARPKPLEYPAPRFAGEAGAITGTQ
jgi:hypothetical protein